MIQPYERPAGLHPPLDFPAYKSTQLRAPLRKLVPLPHGLTELTGPVHGWDPVTAADAEIRGGGGGAPAGGHEFDRDATGVPEGSRRCA